MYLVRRIDAVLNNILAQSEVQGGPPQLQAAVRHAVFPGGARIRPRLCLAVAMACQEGSATTSEAAAAAFELLHCASLVHDDLPCFDDASLRRGKPSVHTAYGERIAVLTGDALIVMAFDTVARRVAHQPELVAPLIGILSRAVGMPSGIVAGQAWECETDIDLSTYQRQKTGALFAGATMAGAASVGANPESWRELGEGIGEAFQIADDIVDATSDFKLAGKPVGQDIALDRPSAVRQFGLDGAVSKLRVRVDQAVDSIPACDGKELLTAMVRQEALKFVPAQLMQSAA